MYLSPVLAALLLIKLLIRSLAIRMAAPNPHTIIVKSARASNIQFTKRAAPIADSI